MSSTAAFASVMALQYFDVAPALPPVIDPSAFADPPPPATAGMPHADVEARIAAARIAAQDELRAQLEHEWTLREQALQTVLTDTVQRFADERSTYFANVESEVVHLALAIARKILVREAQLDPLLLAGLVRIALDGMQSGPAVRLCVSPDRIDAWHSCRESLALRRTLEIVADPALSGEACRLETELGSAHLSCDTQLKELERGFQDLLGQRPDRTP